MEAALVPPVEVLEERELERQFGAHVPGQRPADDPPAEHVDDEGDYVESDVCQSSSGITVRYLHEWEQGHSTR